MTDPDEISDSLGAAVVDGRNVVEDRNHACRRCKTHGFITTRIMGGCEGRLSVSWTEKPQVPVESESRGFRSGSGAV